MQIIGGTHKGRKLIGLNGEQIRPTGAKIRGAVFNMMAPYIEGAIFLDGFAGSGAMGIEALSRGVSSSVFVDSCAQSIAVLEKNLQKLGLKEQSIVRRDNFFHFIKKTDIKFDIIFIDPPYAMAEVSEMVSLVAEADVLQHGGFLIAEHDVLVLLKADERLQTVKQKKYGNTIISVFERM